jgi:hypothetical protein
MRPPLWHPPIELSTAEHAIITRIRRAKLCVFLRQHRHALFAEAFQEGRADAIPRRLHALVRRETPLLFGAAPVFPLPTSSPSVS